MRKYETVTIPPVYLTISKQFVFCIFVRLLKCILPIEHTYACFALGGSCEADFLVGRLHSAMQLQSHVCHQNYFGCKLLYIYSNTIE